MKLNICGGEMEIKRHQAEEIIKQQLNKLSKEDLIDMLLDRDGEYLDLEEYFREEITDHYKGDVWEESLNKQMYGYWE